MRPGGSVARFPIIFHCSLAWVFGRLCWSSVDGRFHPFLTMYWSCTTTSEPQPGSQGLRSQHRLDPLLRNHQDNRRRRIASVPMTGQVHTRGSKAGKPATWKHGGGRGIKFLIFALFNGWCRWSRSIRSMHVRREGARVPRRPVLSMTSRHAVAG